MGFTTLHLVNCDYLRWWIVFIYFQTHVYIYIICTKNRSVYTCIYIYEHVRYIFIYFIMWILCHSVPNNCPGAIDKPRSAPATLWPADEPLTAATNSAVLSVPVAAAAPTALPPLMPAVGMCHGRSWWEGWGRKMWKCLPVRKFVSGESIYCIYIYTVCILSEIIRYIYIYTYTYIYTHSYYYII